MNGAVKELSFLLNFNETTVVCHKYYNQILR